MQAKQTHACNKVAPALFLLEKGSEKLTKEMPPLVYLLMASGCGLLED